MLSQSEPVNNGSKEVLHTHQSFYNGALLHQHCSVIPRKPFFGGTLRLCGRCSYHILNAIYKVKRRGGKEGESLRRRNLYIDRFVQLKKNIIYLICIIDYINIFIHYNDCYRTHWDYLNWYWQQIHILFRKHHENK